ncbi:carbonic anhydrase [Streptomyces ficellus]|uniref:Carbonic anhydrase n=1 Tax=Streptomyces ficellus TaxID=1977088 RepID=A0A6I6FDN2_9ACTN|nr:carbonic anhydrase [Streptomyces ficellus]QGV77175.1 carbonic anhydrase [Streptomyces ficellus]
MQALLDHARSFHRQVADAGDTYRRLAAGQSPQALVISCSDSRVVPSLITGARPGEIFELRNAGNIVPPRWAADVSGEVATIEYALEVLGIRDIVICGHSHCGAMSALAEGSDLSLLPGVDAWLSLVRPALVSRVAQHPGSLERLVQLNVVHQLATLGTYPVVRRLLDDDELRLHGWYYRVDTGVLHELDEDGSFTSH